MHILALYSLYNKSNVKARFYNEDFLAVEISPLRYASVEMT